MPIDSMDRAQEMMLVPMKDLPAFAADYARFLCGQIGTCGEVFLTAYAHYAEVVEGRPRGEDCGYWADNVAREFFAEKGGMSRC